MLKLYYGTKLETLAEKLAEELFDNPPENALAKEIFVVQNHGIGQWLSLFLAGKEGIAANLEFEFPSERIWKLIRNIRADIPETLPSERGPMTWSLMQLMQDEELLSEFDNLRYYIRSGDPGREAMRRWKLSGKIADVFDQYLIYRPDLILGWEHEDPRLTYGSQTEIWQSRLWKRLTRHWRKNHEGEWLHRAELQHKLIEELDNNHFDITSLPERLTVFGVSSMPPVFIEVLIKLSKRIDVCFYQLTVDPDTGDCREFRNPLLQSLAKEGADFMDLFASTVKNSGEVPYSRERLNAHRRKTARESAFREIQADLVTDSPLGGRNLNVPAADSSLSVHSCHSPMREVEVLYDQLLAALEEDPELTPDDILIMTPDIETYAPVVEAVFGSPDEGQPKIPFSIADRGIQGGNPAIESFVRMLQLCESRFKVTDVMDLLDRSPIRENFDLNNDDLNRLELWIRDNRVRWGIDGPFKRKIDLPGSPHFTWRSGLDRMLLGYVMKAGNDQLFDGISPYGEVETSDDAELAGKFARFLNALFEVSTLAGKRKTAEEWSERLLELLNTFIADNRDYFREISRIRDVVKQLKNYTDLAGHDRDIPFSIVRSRLIDQLEEQSTGGGRIGRGVTFSSLMPMRCIPFKMIGMIGMNEGAFPRSKIPIEFDLINAEPAKGDPLRSEEDRYLFLENLLSAENTLYFSYVGQSNRQDIHFPPSVVLREFCDYLEEYYGLETADIVTEHRLQAFSPQYFKDQELFSYSRDKKNIADALAGDDAGNPPFIKGSLPEPPQDQQQLSLGSLISFFQHPAKYLLRNRLGLFLGRDDVLTDDREPFSLEGLDRYQVEQELLDRYIKKKPLEGYEKNLRSRDMLPEGWSGEEVYQQKVGEVREFGSRITEMFGQRQLDDREIDLKIGNYRLVGRLSNIFEKGVVNYRFGRGRPRDIVDFWIRHLIFQEAKAENQEGHSFLFTRDRRKGFEEYRLEPITDVKPILASLFEMYWRGLQQCIYFFPETSMAYAEEVVQRNRDPETGLSKAASKWIRDYGYPGEGEDAYNKLLLGTESPLEKKTFRDISEQFWSPYFEALTEEK